MTPTSDSKSRDPLISSTDEVTPIMVPVTDTSIIVSVGSILTKSINNQFSTTTNIPSIPVLPNSSINENIATSSTYFIGLLVSSKVTILSTILPKLSRVDKVNSPSTTSIYSLPNSTAKLTTIIDSNLINC